MEIKIDTFHVGRPGTSFKITVGNVNLPRMSVHDLAALEVQIRWALIKHEEAKKN